MLGIFLVYQYYFPSVNNDAIHALSNHTALCLCFSEYILELCKAILKLIVLKSHLIDSVDHLNITVALLMDMNPNVTIE